MKTCLEGIETGKLFSNGLVSYVGMKTCLEGIETSYRLLADRYFRVGMKTCLEGIETGCDQLTLTGFVRRNENLFRGY